MTFQLNKLKSTFIDIFRLNINIREIILLGFLFCYFYNWKIYRTFKFTTFIKNPYPQTHIALEES